MHDTDFSCFFLIFLGSQHHHAHEVEIFSILEYMKNRLEGLFRAIISHFGHVTDLRFLKKVVSITLHMKLRHFQS